MAADKSPQNPRPVDPKPQEPQPEYPQGKMEYPGSPSRMDPKPDHGETTYRGLGRLRDRVALVTGADSGIGRAVAIAFAREGADVVLAYLPEEEADARETCRWVADAGRRALALPGDIRQEAHCAAMIDRTFSELGRLDILVNNAAYQSTFERIEDITTEEFDRTFKTNMYAYFWLARAALRHMQRGAAIIATSSETGIMGSKELPDYSATKGAINAFTKTLALELIALISAALLGNPKLLRISRSPEKFSIVSDPSPATMRKRSKP